MKETRKMLKLLIDDLGNTPVTDVEMLFKQIKIRGTIEECTVISKIEQGKYNDENSFIDRFGYKLYLSELSTGCKAALCVLNRPDILINLIECGINAVDVILTTCKKGNVVMRDRGITIKDYSEDGKIEVELDGYVFTTVKRLNYYLFNERPFEPDFSIGGIEHVQ